jgi:thiamine biosynthesis protein ThiI
MVQNQQSVSETASAPAIANRQAGRLVVVHFDAVALTGGRRRYFARKLLENIRRAISSQGSFRVRSLYDRILIGPVSEERLAAVVRSISDLPGVAWYSRVQRLPVACESLPLIADSFSAGGRGRSFAVRTRRAKKDFPLVSTEINAQVGRMIQDRTGWTVDLDDPDLSVYVDVTPQGILTYSEKHAGPGGLPVGSMGKLVCLLSGGIDSPVAAYKMMCRGCRIVFVHYHNFGPQAQGVRRKLLEIVERLSLYQAHSRLYLVPFAEVQSNLIAAVPPKQRMVAYRRAMLRLAAPILEAERGLGLVVGDSVGQVASQTLENLNATYRAAGAPVFAPLIGDSKRTIMDTAKRIGTYEPSILPYEDCCQLLVSKSPDTRCRGEELEEYERQIALEDYCRGILEKSEVIEIGGC